MAGSVLFGRLNKGTGLRLYVVALVVGFIVYIGNNNHAFAQRPYGPAQIDSLQQQEAKLHDIGDSMVDGKRQATRVRSLKRFIPALIEALKIPGSFNYPFDSLRYMFTFTPPDKRFRLYNWHINFADNTFRYYGVIQMKNDDSLQLYPLYDRVEDALLNARDTVLGREGWYGAQYFKMIQQEIDGKKYYTMLGWDGFNHTMNRKLIDVIHFTKTGKPRFGAPIFLKNGNKQKRVMWKYNNKAKMQVEYDADEQVIAFDHLVPPNNKRRGMKNTYVPDGTYDYYKFMPKKGLWMFKEQYFPDEFTPAEDSENANQEKEDE